MVNKVKKVIGGIGVAGLAAFVFAQSALATTVLTFEGLKNFEPIEDFYNGGVGGMGSSGPDYGISFTSDSLAVIAKDHGGTGNFTGSMAPSPGTLGFFLSGQGDTMNVFAGFDTGFSFFYTSPYWAGSVTVWDGLNGSGTQLASLALDLTTDTSVATGYPYDDWRAQGVSFSGIAKSAVFSGVANEIGFDNITLGSSVPQSTPDSGPTLGLLGLGLAGLFGVRRKICGDTVQSE